MYRWFCPPGGHVLDPFAGGPVRGTVAGVLGYGYTGIDLRPKQVEENRVQWATIFTCGLLRLPAVTTPSEGVRWVAGDSVEVLAQNGEGGPAQVDFVFTCPPYFDLEVYSDDKRDLSRMSEEQFVAAYRKIVALAVARLRPNRFAAVVVGEVRGKDGFYQNLVQTTVDAFEEAGARFYNDIVLVTKVGSMALKASKSFGGGRKVVKGHQNVLVFFKGNPRNIPKHFPRNPPMGMPEEQ
jgi:DNA modification methylase